MGGLGLKLYEPEPVSFPENGQGVFGRIKVIQVQCGDLAGPGAGIVE